MEVLAHEIRVAETEGLTNLTIAGTEPFLHLDHDTESSGLATRRTFEILEALGAMPRGYRLGIVSNGLGIHRHWDALAALAQKGAFDYIDLSIDSGDVPAHDRIRGRKGAGMAVLAALREANQRLNGVRIGTSSVLRQDNAKGVLQLIQEQAGCNRHYFVTPIQPLSLGKGVQPTSLAIVHQFVCDLTQMFGESTLHGRRIEVTLLITGLYIHDLIMGGVFTWDEVEDIGGHLSVTRMIGGNTLRIELSILPSYGLTLGLLEFTGDYLPHAHALQIPHEQRKEWVAGNITHEPLRTLHERGKRGVIQRMIRARTDHACRREPCWNTCFGGMAFNMEDAALRQRPLTEKPTACLRGEARRLMIV
jgi:MoaA/NifB/PqqE/SkfB family radical SAM enzyme